MPITEKLDVSWNTNESMDAIFEVRAIIQNLSSVADEAQSRIDEIAASSKFSSVDVDIKSEAQACRTIVNALVNAFAAHSSFISWSQPSSGA